ncbi:MAG: L,D-transpeptidase family protein [Piscinibacter sp.]|nr:L,D-transpeptidase family protein [Piscinibacter sp.]
MTRPFLAASGAALLRKLVRAACGAALACGAVAAFAGEGWFEQGRPGPQARQATLVLAAAASHGLDPRDYRAAALQQALAQAEQGTPLDRASVERIEAGLTWSMERYLKDVHEGRVDPRQLHQRYSPVRKEPFDASATLRDALLANRVAEAARDAAPRMPLYERLRDALARYRALSDEAWRAPLPALPAATRGRDPKLEAGQPWAGLPALARRLTVLGDLASGTQVPAVYEGPLVDAVKTFQRRHGLSEDGVIGKATLAQLQVPPSARLRQIELALERLRWTPLLQGPRMIVINIPEFVLRAYEVQGERIAVQAQMKVIVGKALDTRTPLFDADLRYVEFSPYWNVPPSIARGETVPRLRRDPAYFTREGFEFVAPDGRVDTTLSAANIDALQRGQLRIRQRPGPRNALGKVKFVFPNDDHIYLHYTPSVELFARDRRDFSHGCIRVEEPLVLAEFVMRGTPDWTRERIVAAMDSGESTTVRVAAPLRVLITYGTALVKQGEVHFLQDIYGQDRLLDAALRQNAVRRRTMD